jgi:hypothetical protein
VGRSLGTQARYCADQTSPEVTLALALAVVHSGEKLRARPATVQDLTSPAVTLALALALTLVHGGEKPRPQAWGTAPF